MFLCSKCGAKVSYNQRYCTVCSTDVGFPNVRFAKRAEEAQALNARYVQARDSAEARGVADEFTRFEKAVDNSKAVMSRSLGALSEWLNGASPLFQAFHKQVAHLGRQPNETAWDQQREAAESAINPYCFNELNYAALSLDRTGMTYYGNYTVTLKSVTIEDRASVFEKNVFFFNEEHSVIAGRRPPFGFRAPWPEKGKLAATKLEPKLTSGMLDEEFPDVLMEARRNEPECDFVEVHIYGAVNREGIEHIIGPCPTARSDKALWRQALRKAAELGIDVKESG